MDGLYTKVKTCESGTATASKILSGYKAYYNGALVTGTIPSKAAQTYTPGTSNQTISSGQYLSGTQTIKGDSNLVAGNIKCGTAIFGITGTHNCALYDKVKIGDYISMTPNTTSFKIPKTLTGYTTSDQTIRPSELNLWRVISKNTDGTIDLVSEYTSSTPVYFVGKTGYLNFVGTLNLIAKQYENSGYTIGSRHMGYKKNYTTEYIADDSKFAYPAPWKGNYGDSSAGVDGSYGYESQGGGEDYYEDDVNLVRKIASTGQGIMAIRAGTSNTVSDYWLASRHYTYYDTYSFKFNARYVNSSGIVSFNSIYGYDNTWCDTADDCRYGSYIRPIITLKAGITDSSGTGSYNSPYVLTSKW